MRSYGKNPQPDRTDKNMWSIPASEGENHARRGETRKARRGKDGTKITEGHRARKRMEPADKKSDENLDLREKRLNFGTKKSIKIIRP